MNPSGWYPQDDKFSVDGPQNRPELMVGLKPQNCGIHGVGARRPQQYGCPPSSTAVSHSLGFSSGMAEMSPSDSSFKLILGSSSKSRRQILSEMGFEFTILSADIDEKEIRMEKPEELVMALAEAKADAVISKLRSSGFEEEDARPTLLITADQVVVHGGTIREKPSSAEEAREFIKGYSAGHASTVGSVLVTNLKTGIRKGGCDKAEIYFHKIPDEVIDNLIEEGDVLYVAGGLMVEHPMTSPLVEAIVGTIDSVMGLPKALTQRLIREALQ